MAYYLLDYQPRRCQSCGKPAKYELMTSGTCSYGYFCTKCGFREMHSRNEQLNLTRDYIRTKEKP